jgi:hypothetical protein
MSIASREKIKEYTLRRLGAPVITINVDDQQLEDRLDDALQLFAEYHFDGVEKRFYKYQVTQEDLDRFNADPMNGGYIETNGVDPGIISIIRIFSVGGDNINMFDIRYQMALHDFYGIRSGYMDLANYTIYQQNLSLIRHILDPEKSIRFSRVTNKLYINMNWKDELVVGDYLVFECYTVLDPEVNTEIYNDRLLKKYYTALVKRQWGQNLSKFDNIQLPGGVAFNGRELFEQANTEIEKIEEEIQLRFELPVDFMTG